MDCSPLGSSVHGILQMRILEWVTMAFSRRPPQSRMELTSLASPAWAGGFFTTSATREARGGKVGERIDWKIGNDIYKLL